MADGATTSVEELVRSHLPLIHFAVADVQARVPRFVHRDDLVSAAMFGLAQAAGSWDPARGVRFERFARTRIRGALLDELRSRDWASRSVRADGRRLQVATDELGADLHRAPTATEVADRLGMAPEDVRHLQDDLHRATVLNYDSVFLEGADVPAVPADEVGPLDHLLGRETRAYLHDAVLALPERLRRVVVGYFFEELPMADLAAELGVTESRISQIRAEALDLLGGALRSQLDPELAPTLPPGGRVARRKTAYFARVAAGSDYRSRLSATPRPLVERAAAS